MKTQPKHLSFSSKNFLLLGLSGQTEEEEVENKPHYGAEVTSVTSYTGFRKSRK
jgi:hypothetical protein